jgi:hypothetical protein
VSLIEEVAGRLLRPRACSCDLGCRSRDEMRALHGDPEAFLASLERAFENGLITFAEAERANLRYRAEWAKAPENTEVDRP